MNKNNLFSSVKEYFASDPFFFWCIIIMMSVNLTVSCFNVFDWGKSFVTIAFIYYIACILSVSFSAMKKVGTFLKYLGIIIVSLYDLLVLFCFMTFHTFLDVNIVETLIATNANEIREFVNVFFPWWIMLLFIAVVSAIILTHHYCHQKFKMGSKQITIHLYMLTYITIVMLICHKQVYAEVSNMNSWIIPFENLAINMKDYEPSHINLKETSNQHPQKIVVIIGESHAKGHCSLYGYEKETNPRLKHLVQDSLAYVFKNVRSPATATTASFKYILNTRRLKDFDKDWYSFPSIITIMKSAGYHTSWLSNQDEVGLYDNMASCYAHICDEYTFNKNEERLDGNLIELHKPTKSKEFVIYHLMGQHVDFSKRYPNKSFGKFKDTDYDPRKCDERQVAAHYDNACLYNDFVVSSIMNLYKNEDAIVIYFPDHGLDVFESSPKYFGHAHSFVNHERQIGYEIPFVIYTTQTFKQQHPSVVNSIESSLNKDFCTSDITFTIMDIAGYEFKDCNDANMPCPTCK